MTFEQLRECQHLGQCSGGFQVIAGALLLSAGEVREHRGGVEEKGKKQRREGGKKRIGRGRREDKEGNVIRFGMKEEKKIMKGDERTKEVI